MTVSPDAMRRTGGMLDGIRSVRGAVKLRAEVNSDARVVPCEMGLGAFDGVDGHGQARSRQLCVS